MNISSNNNDISSTPKGVDNNMNISSNKEKETSTSLEVERNDVSPNSSNLPEENYFDIIIIGAGAGGLNIASFMNKAGFKVLIVDKTDKNIGGDCLNFGCIPSKALIHISKLIHNSKSLNNFGLKVSGKVDIKKVMKYVNDKKEIIRTHDNADYLIKRGINVVLGEARFNSKKSIIVNEQEYFSKKIIIATGTSPRRLNIKGINDLKYGINLFDNKSIFNLTKLPKNLVMIGAGPISIELGQALNRLGSKVTIIHSHDRILPKENPEIANLILEKLKKEGITFYFNSRPLELNKNKLIFDSNLKNKTINFDALFVGIGRVINLPNGIDIAGIKTNEDDNLILNNYLQTTNKSVYAIGDVVGSYKFTHAAELQASVLIKNFFSPFKKKLSYDNFSWVTYTDPEIATFGLNEIELQNRKIKYEILSQDFTRDDRSIVDDATYGKLILYINNNKILGGSMIAKNAGELFQELVLANSSNLNIKQIFNKIYPYPTASRINKRIITSHLAKRLTPFKKSILKFFYSKF